MRVKRVPDLAIGLPGLLAWYWLEFQRLPPIPTARVEVRAASKQP
jgi:hypothetical protein